MGKCWKGENLFFSTKILDETLLHNIHSTRSVAKYTRHYKLHSLQRDTCTLNSLIIIMYNDHHSGSNS